MSSDFYPASLSRNLIRTGTSGYRQNAGHCRLADDALAIKARRDPPSACFLAFPDFGGRRRAGALAHLRIVSLKNPSDIQLT